jgi:long-chain acyl-CoA synthetase
MANIAAHLFERARNEASRTAIVFDEARLSFGEIHSRVCRVAAALAAAGFRTGDKLALFMHTSPDFIVYEYAAFALGGIVVPLNVHYQAIELETVLGYCDVEYLIADGDLLHSLGTDGAARLPALRRVYCRGPRPAAIRALSIEDAAALLAHPAVITEPAEHSTEDVALMLQTSATTGRAKAVLLTVGNLQYNYDRTPGWLGIDGSDRILCALPLYNTFALNQCINAIMVTGAELVLLPRFDTLECLDAVQRYRCTFFPAVPTMLQKVLNDPRAAQYDLSSLKRFLVGAAPVPAPLLQQVYATIGSDAVVMTGYGLTEASALVSLEHTALGADGNLVRPKSVGKPLPGMKMILTDPSGAEVGPGQVGEVRIAGPNLMQGYYKMPEATAEALVNGWLRTGDLAVMDEAGHFYIVDRQKDLIIRGGQNVYPADIECVLYSHPAVTEAAVIGRPDDVMGEVPVAFVALRPGAEASAEELLALCKRELAYFKVPKALHVIPDLPKGPTGKILRRVLRKMLVT